MNKVICFSAIKGGVGKSSLSIITANMLAKAGNKVLVIDLDIQNSASFYYLDDSSIVEQKNIAVGLQENNLVNHIVPTVINNVDIIPSSFFLVDLRAISEHRLKKIIPDVLDLYDYIIIDTAPTWDNICLNAINASDLIISPVQLSQFNYKGASFYREKLATETTKVQNWYILINSYVESSSASENSLSSQYLQLFRDEFNNILETNIPRSTYIQKYIDTGETISTAVRKRNLFNAMKEFTETICGIDLTEIKRL